MRRQLKDQVHAAAAAYEDKLLFGTAVFRQECSCGWRSRECSSPDVAWGLWHRHVIMAGRGYNHWDDHR